jgi:trehalose utilization protein
MPVDFSTGKVSPVNAASILVGWFEVAEAIQKGVCSKIGFGSVSYVMIP